LPHCACFPMSLFLEDHHPGDTFAYGTHTFTAEAIKTFAAKYDPQPFHLDEAAAERSVSGGLRVSGWHTAAVWMRLMVERELQLVAEMTAAGQRVGQLGPSPGVSDMRFLKPVRPGDTLTYAGAVVAIEGWRGRPAWGVLVTSNWARNQHGEEVFSFVGRVLVERRTPLGGA
jgi:acyl dehydratase